MTYTIYEAATLIGVNPETVRRWIRSGKLVATMTSKKEGYIIKQTDLQGVYSKDSAALDDAYRKEMLETKRMIQFHEAKYINPYVVCKEESLISSGGNEYVPEKSI